MYVLFDMYLSIFRSSDPFISVQLEKSGPRDVIANAFLQAVDAKTVSMNDVEDVEKLKRKLLSDFCHEYVFDFFT